jgi:hypothetical protein
MSGQLDLSKLEGTFPLLGPVPYIAEDEITARGMLTGQTLPAESTWWHVTYPENLSNVLRTGLAPSCWWGSDGCAVFGIDSRVDVPTWRRDHWVLEIRSRALPDSAKAWWVPPRLILGGWQQDRFYSRTQLLAQERNRERQHIGWFDGCICSLSGVCREQQSAWRATWEDFSD